MRSKKTKRERRRDRERERKRKKEKERLGGMRKQGMSKKRPKTVKQY